MTKLAARDHVDRFLRRELGAGFYRGAVILFEPIVGVTDDRKKSVRWLVLTADEVMLLDNPPRKILHRIPLTSITSFTLNCTLPGYLSKDLSERAQHVELRFPTPASSKPRTAKIRRRPARRRSSRAQTGDAWASGGIKQSGSPEPGSHAASLSTESVPSVGVQPPSPTAFRTTRREHTRTGSGAHDRGLSPSQPVPQDQHSDQHNRAREGSPQTSASLPASAKSLSPLVARRTPTPTASTSRSRGHWKQGTTSTKDHAVDGLRVPTTDTFARSSLRRVSRTGSPSSTPTQPRTPPPRTPPARSDGPRSLSPLCTPARTSSPQQQQQQQQQQQHCEEDGKGHSRPSTGTKRSPSGTSRAATTSPVIFGTYRRATTHGTAPLHSRQNTGNGGTRQVSPLSWLRLPKGRGSTRGGGAGGSSWGRGGAEQAHQAGDTRAEEEGQGGVERGAIEDGAQANPDPVRLAAADSRLSASLPSLAATAADDNHSAEERHHQLRQGTMNEVAGLQRGGRAGKRFSGAGTGSSRSEPRKKSAVTRVLAMIGTGGDGNGGSHRRAGSRASQHSGQSASTSSPSPSSPSFAAATETAQHDGSKTARHAQQRRLEEECERVQLPFAKLDIFTMMAVSAVPAMLEHVLQEKALAWLGSASATGQQSTDVSRSATPSPSPSSSPSPSPCSIPYPATHVRSPSSSPSLSSSSGDPPSPTELAGQRTPAPTTVERNGENGSTHRSVAAAHASQSHTAARAGQSQSRRLSPHIVSTAQGRAGAPLVLSNSFGPPSQREALHTPLTTLPPSSSPPLNTTTTRSPQQQLQPPPQQSVPAAHFGPENLAGSRVWDPGSLASAFRRVSHIITSSKTATISGSACDHDDGGGGGGGGDHRRGQGAEGEVADALDRLSALVRCSHDARRRFWKDAALLSRLVSFSQASVACLQAVAAERVLGSAWTAETEETVIDALEDAALLLDVLVPAVRWSPALPGFVDGIFATTMTIAPITARPSAVGSSCTSTSAATSNGSHRESRAEPGNGAQRRQSCGHALTAVCVDLTAAIGTVLRSCPQPHGVLLSVARDAKYGALELVDALVASAAAISSPASSITTGCSGGGSAKGARGYTARGWHDQGNNGSARVPGSLSDVDQRSPAAADDITLAANLWVHVGGPWLFSTSTESLAPTPLGLLDFAVRFSLRTLNPLLCTLPSSVRRGDNSPQPSPTSSLASTPLPQAPPQATRGAVTPVHLDTLGRCFRCLRLLACTLAQADPHDVAVRHFLGVHGTRLRYTLAQQPPAVWTAAVEAALGAHDPAPSPMVCAVVADGMGELVAEVSTCVKRLLAP